MNRASTLTLVALLSGGGLLRAQNPFSDDARQTYALIKDSLVKAAEKMPIKIVFIYNLLHEFEDFQIGEGTQHCEQIFDAV